MTPESVDGYKYLDVMVDLFSHHVQIYPRKSHDALSLAQNLFTYYTTWGIYDEIITDPGSDILSDAVITLNCCTLRIDILTSIIFAFHLLTTYIDKHAFAVTRYTTLHTYSNICISQT